MQIEVYKTFMQIRILLVLLCVLFMTPNGVYAKAGNGENTPHHAKRIFNPDSRTGRNNHSLLLKTNVAAWGNGNYERSGGI